MNVRPIVVILLALASLRTPAAACSFDEGPARSNFELVANARGVAIAEANAATSLEVVEVIRGIGLARGERLPALVDAPVSARPPKPSFDLTDTGAYDTACRRHFMRGRRYLVVVDEQDRHWFVSSLKLARVAAEVVATGDPWAVAVTEYARIALLSPTDQIAALDALVAKGAAPAATRIDQVIAADVKRHRTTPSQFKTRVELQDIFAHGDDAAAATALAILGANADPAAHDFMRDVADRLAAGRLPLERGGFALLDGVVRYFERVIDDHVTDELATLYLAIDYPHRLFISHLLLARGDPRHQATLERGLARAVASGLHGMLAADSEAAQLADWFVSHPSPRALALVQSRVRGNYATIDFDLAFAVAELGDEGVLRYAVRGLGRPLRPASDAANEARDELVELVAASPLDDADRAAAAMIDRNARAGRDLGALIRGYARAHHPHVDARLAQILARPDLSPADRTAVEEIVARRKAKPAP